MKIRLECEVRKILRINSDIELSFALNFWNMFAYSYAQCITRFMFHVALPVFADKVKCSGPSA